MAKNRTKIIACQTVGEELKTILPADYEMELLDYALHNVPKNLHIQLQAAIDRTPSDFDTILIGYGMCANAIIGIKSRSFKLVIPKADDCITIFLGSKKEYIKQIKSEPGTFYLTKGWIECGEDPYTEYCAMREKYGEEKAYRITKRYIENYTRLALITSEKFDSEAYRKYAKMVADHFDLNYEEILGSSKFLDDFIHGNWEKEFVIVPPGQEVEYGIFYEDGS